VKVADFDFELPPEAVAQHPQERRDGSRLLVLPRGGGPLEHRRFHELDRLLEAGDLLVLNDTRVVPARLAAHKPSGGRVELLLLGPIAAGERRQEPNTWRALLRSSRAPREGVELEMEGGLRATVAGRDDEGWLLRFAGDVERTMAEHGRMPLPPYIHRDGSDAPEDRERYQTVYARRPGAVAAPTAGLHFTGELLERLRKRGIRIARLTLHVGAGTFRPVRTEEVERHRMHDEWCDLPEETARAVLETRRAGARVVAVGTTVVRTLESRMGADGTLATGPGRCDLFIYPGFRFRAIDAVVTNFHLPRSTLLMLVAAFAGREPLLASYRAAVAEGYRFYSYGDAMLVRS
jgi:S-adenosylmethionine:tRNA ribosyltransferase-isomerase